MNGNWIVGGDEVLQRFVISQPIRTNENVPARRWVTLSGLVKVFTDKVKADKTVDRLNRQRQRVATLMA